MNAENAITDKQLDDMPLADLKSLEEALSKTIERKTTERPAEIRQAAEAEARADGLDPSSIFASLPKPKGAKKGGTVRPKYRNPSDSSVTWSGRGKQPRWFKEHVESGKNPEALLIK